MSGNTPTKRAWQRMLSGRRLDLLEPSPLDVEIEDIAHGLARVARWNGQTTGEHAFSVAQHSVLVWKIFCHQNKTYSFDDELTALLHDAPEYVIGDMISPFKSVLGNEYKSVEARLESAIHTRYGLKAITPSKLKNAIKKADAVSAYYEAVLLAGFDKVEAQKLFGVPRNILQNQYDFTPLPAEQAQNLFLDAFNHIESNRNLV